MGNSLLVGVRLVHLVALALAMGAATAKNVLLYGCRRQPSRVPFFLAVEGQITAQIIVGQVLLTLSGIAYAYLLDYSLTPRLMAKVGLLSLVWVLGPTIDRVVSPALKRAAADGVEPPSPALERALGRYLFWDLAATGLFYAIVVLWVLTA